MLLAWVYLEGDEKQVVGLAWVCLEGDEKAGRQGGLQVVGVGMLRGRLKGGQAGMFAGCWRGYAQRAMKSRMLAWVCLEGDEKAGRQGGLQVVGVGMLRGR